MDQPGERLLAPDFRRLFEVAPNCYLVLNRDSLIAAVSDSYLKATKSTREEILGRHPLDVFPGSPDDAARQHARPILDSVARVLATGEIDVLPLQKYDIRRPDSEGGGFEEHYWSIVNSPVVGADGQVEFVIHCVEDVTELALHRQSLEAQEKRSAELAHRASLLELDIAIRSAELRKSNRELHRTNIELNAIRADLEQRIELRTADLQRRNQVLEEIAYAASHDLQEPLRAVAGYCQLLLMEHAAQLPPEASDYLQKASAGAQRMSAMVKGILQFARMPKDTNSMQPVDADEAYMEALTGLEAMISDSGATVLRGNLPTVDSDPVLLTQLFQNLISNAIKYRSERPPVVMVDARKSDSEWVFSVADNGVGIPPESRDRVFAIFQRLQPRHEVPGTGIGLALCRQIVEWHGGRIWIDSPKGLGTTVSFTIPIRSSEALEAGGTPDAAP